MGTDKETRVLIAEDDFLVAEMIRSQLEKAGYKVAAVAVNGQQAVEMVQSLRPDLVLMDIAMPVMDGLEATRRIQTSCPTPVVILTAFESPELLEDASRAGSGAYLVKPANPGELERAITLAKARFADMMILRRRNQQLEMLNRASQAFGSSLDLDQVLIRVLEEVRQELGVSSSSSWLQDPETGQMVCRHATGAKKGVVQGWRLDPGQGFVGYAVVTGQSLVVEDARFDERHFKGVDRRSGTEYRSILCVPLRVKGKGVGVIQVVDKEPGRFGRSDLTLVEMLSAAASIAIENARLYGETDRLRSFNQNIVDSLAEGIVLEDEVGTITFVNPTLARLLDYQVEDLIGKHWTVLTSPDWLDNPENEISLRHTHGEHASQYETVLLTRQGRELPVIISARKLWEQDASSKGQQPRMTGVLTTVTDISERKRMQEMLLASQKMAGLGTLAAGVAHEVNSPLQIITGTADRMLDMLDKGQDGDGGEARVDRDQMRGSVETISRNAWRVAEIVRSLSVYARPLTDTAHFHELNQVVGEALRAIEPQMDWWPGVSISTRLAPDMPTLLCDGQAIAQALVNLLTNAGDAMPEGGQITVVTAYQPSPEGEGLPFSIQVSDTGAGIPVDIRNRIFDPFFTTKPVGSGVGLGLSVVMGIVRGHGGKVELESLPGQGSTFTLLLPERRELPEVDELFPTDQASPGRFDDFIQSTG